MTYDEAREVAREFLAEFNPTHWNKHDNPPESVNTEDTWEYKINDSFSLLICMDINIYDEWCCYIDLLHLPDDTVWDSACVYNLGNKNDITEAIIAVTDSVR